MQRKCTPPHKGQNKNEGTRQAKGFLPVLTDTERQQAVLGCRFVDELLVGRKGGKEAAFGVLVHVSFKGCYVLNIGGLRSVQDVFPVVYLVWMMYAYCRSNT